VGGFSDKRWQKSPSFPVNGKSMLAIKTMLVLGLVLLWACASAAAEEKSLPDSSSTEAPRKSGRTFLKPGLTYEPFLVRSHFDAFRITRRTDLNKYIPGKKQTILTFCSELAENLDQYQRIAGVPALQEALSVSVEFFYFYKDFATYGSPRLHTGLKFPWIESRNLKTGIHYNF